MRRVGSSRILSLIVLAAAVVCGREAAAEGRRPNFVFVLTDDQRWDSLGCMGNSIVRTPHIDRLAAKGTLFSSMFCTTSICPVSRVSFITGQYESKHRINDFRTPLTPHQFSLTFPAQLRQHGYRTGMVGKWGIGGPLPAGEYDDFKGFAGQGRYFPMHKEAQPGPHLTRRLRAQALEFLDGCTPAQPFLLQVYTKSAHVQDGGSWPFQPDPKYNDLFADATIPKPVTATGRHFKALPDFLQTSEARKRWYVRFATDELYQKSVKDYYRLIAGIDDLVGAIVARLQEKRLADDTVIVFSSDNGFFLGEHGLAGKWFMHEESIRLPLVIYDPRSPASRKGARVDKLVLNIDVAPTILDLAGIEIPQTVQGTSLVPLLSGREVDWRNEFFYEHHFEHPRIPKSEGVRGRRWKYTRYTSVEPEYEALYDLETDPHEEHNLAGDPRFAEQLARMRIDWEKWRKRAMY